MSDPISNDPYSETFFYFKDSEAKRRLSNALISEKQSIVDAWIDIVCRCTQSNVSNKTKDELISDLGKRVNNSETNRESNNGVEKKLLEVSSYVINSLLLNILFYSLR